MLNFGGRVPWTTILSALINERPLSKLQSETGSSGRESLALF